MNFRRIIAGALAVSLLGGAALGNNHYTAPDFFITANAEDEFTVGTYEGLRYWAYSDHVEIKSFSGSGSVVIPDEIEGLPVTIVQPYAFRMCSGITDVTFSRYTESIGYNAFASCTGITEFNISDESENFTSENGVIFTKDKTKLVLFPPAHDITEYVVPDGVTSIDTCAFMYCENLTSVTIPEGVTLLEGYSFSYCTALVEINLPKSLKTIETWSLSSPALTEIVIPSGVTNIDIFALADCDSLTSVTIRNPKCVINDNSRTISNGHDDDMVGYYTGTIYGYKNSTAQAYAEKYGYKFEALGDAPSTYTPGDVNGDGEINPTDATLVLQHFSYTSMDGVGVLDDAHKMASDVNSDGEVNPTDATYILSYFSYISMGGTLSLRDYITK